MKTKKWAIAAAIVYAVCCGELTASAVGFRIRWIFLPMAPVLPIPLPIPE
jgi:hypothetical protein